MVLNAVLILFGLTALTIGAECLVRGASRIAAMLGISPLVIGLTVVAFGTSAPEATVSILSAFRGQADIAVGNVVGSNIFNVLAILGLCALIAPLVVSQRVVRLDVPLVVVASFLLYWMSGNLVIGRLEGLVLFGGVIVYTGWTIRTSRHAGVQQKTEAQESSERIENTGKKSITAQAGLVVIGLGLLIFGSHLLVTGSVAIARLLQVSELIIGLTIVAMGTSLPELATSIVAGLRGETDIAVGNVVGSNLFNILAVLGLSAVVAPSGIPVSKTAFDFDIPVMIAVAVACLPIFFTGHRISRWEGALFFGYYFLYLTFLIVAAGGHSSLRIFSQAMTMFVLPLTALTLIVSAARAFYKGEWREL